MIYTCWSWVQNKIANRLLDTWTTRCDMTIQARVHILQMKYHLKRENMKTCLQDPSQINLVK